MSPASAGLAPRLTSEAVPISIARSLYARAAIRIAAEEYHENQTTRQKGERTETDQARRGRKRLSKRPPPVTASAVCHLVYDARRCCSYSICGIDEREYRENVEIRIALTTGPRTIELTKPLLSALGCMCLGKRISQLLHTG